MQKVFWRLTLRDLLFLVLFASLFFAWRREAAQRNALSETYQKFADSTYLHFNGMGIRSVGENMGFHGELFVERLRLPTTIRGQAEFFSVSDRERSTPMARVDCTLQGHENADRRPFNAFFESPELAPGDYVLRLSFYDQHGLVIEVVERPITLEMGT